VARQIAVKVRYGAWITRAEKDAMATVLSNCPDEPLPGGAAAAPPEAPPDPAPAAGYRDCAAVEAAGKAPIRAGDPGWEAAFDGDGGGVGCES
jgi:hypothetical protein